MAELNDNYIHIRNYKLNFDDEIGRGSYGNVYQGIDKNTGEVVAAKRVRYTGNDKTINTKLFEMAQKEGEISRSLNKHKNIVKLFDAFDYKSSYWFIMEYCGLGDLADYMKGHTLDLNAKVRIMVDTASGLAFMHGIPIIHRDIKAENILMKLEGNCQVAKLSDFGMGKLFEADAKHFTMKTADVGTCTYWAPEFFAADGKAISYHPSIDTFALGLLYSVVLLKEKDNYVTFPLSANIRASDEFMAYGQEMTNAYKDNSPMPRLFGQGAEINPCVAQIKKIISEMTQFQDRDRPGLQQVKMQILESHYELTQFENIASVLNEPKLEDVDLQRDHNTLQRVQIDLAEVKIGKSKLQGDLGNLQTDHDRLVTEKIKLKTDNERLHTSIGEIKSRAVSELQSQKSEFEKRCEKLDFVNKQLQGENEDMTTETESLKSKIQDLELQLQDVKHRKYEIDGEMKRYREERDVAKQQIQQIQIDNDRKVTQLEHEKSELAKRSKDMATRKVTQLEHDKSEFEKRCQELQSMNQQLQKSKKNIATRKVTQLEHDKSEFEKRCQELQSMNQQLQKSKKNIATRYRDERDAARQEIHQMQADNNRKVTQLEHDKSELAKGCQELQNMNQYLQKSKEDLYDSLAQEMGNKLAADESSVENVSIKNRPVNIADDYNLFCSDEWLDAKTAVDEKMGGMDVPEQHKLQMLHHILLVAYAEADAVIGPFKQNTDTLFKRLYAPDQFCTEKDPLHSPLGNPSDKRSTIAMTDSRKMTPAEMKKLTQSAVPIQSKKSSKIMLEVTEPRAPTELTNSVGDFLRNTVDIVHLDGIVQHVLRKLDAESQSLTATSPGKGKKGEQPAQTESQSLTATSPAKGKKGEQPAQTEYMQLWLYVREEAHVKHYIVKAVKLAWKMVIQRPKMNFAPTETEWRGEKYQDVYWGSYMECNMTTKKPLVYEVFPRICHGEKAMSKAKVYLVNPRSGKWRQHQPTHF